MRSGSALRAVGALASALLASSSWVSSARAQDWVVTGAETREHESITLDGDLIEESGGSLTLRGVALTFDNTADGQHGIRVKPGGGIDIEAGSVITAASGDARMFFTAEVDSSMVMRDSELRRCGWGSDFTWGEGNGLAIHGSVVMENNSNRYRVR